MAWQTYGISRTRWTKTRNPRAHDITRNRDRISSRFSTTTSTRCYNSFKTRSSVLVNRQKDGNSSRTSSHRRWFQHSQQLRTPVICTNALRHFSTFWPSRCETKTASPSMHDINTPTFSNFFKLKTYYFGFHSRIVYYGRDPTQDIFDHFFGCSRYWYFIFVSFQSDIFCLEKLVFADNVVCLICNRWQILWLSWKCVKYFSLNCNIIEVQLNLSCNIIEV